MNLKLEEGDAFNRTKSIQLLDIWQIILFQEIWAHAERSQIFSLKRAARPDFAQAVLVGFLLADLMTE